MSVYRKYFVSYAFYMDTAEGFGTGSVTRSRPVVGHEDVLSMTEAIKKQSPQLVNAKITILNWRRFENEE